MSNSGMRRHRRTRSEPPPAVDQGDTAVQPPIVELESPDTTEFLLYRLHDASAKANEANRQAQAAAGEATRQEQIAAQHRNTEQGLIAKLQQVQADKETAARLAEEARAANAKLIGEHDEFQKRAADAQRLLAAVGVPVDGSGMPPQPGNGSPAASTRIDLAEDLRLDEGVANLMRHHDEDPAGEAGAA